MSFLFFGTMCPMSSAVGDLRIAVNILLSDFNSLEFWLYYSVFQVGFGFPKIVHRLIVLCCYRIRISNQSAENQ